MFYIIIIPIWLLCSFLNYGLEFAYWQNKWPTIAKQHYKQDKKEAIFMSMFGPLALIITLSFIIQDKYYGFKLK